MQKDWKRTPHSKLISIFLATLIAGISIAQIVSGMPLDESGDWPGWRGKNGDGISPETEVFPSETGYRLQIVWRKPLGSGYSSLSIAEGKAITMFSDGSLDYVVAFDAQNGEELWRYPIDATYRGHGGSKDGPISTPLISEGKVYALGPKGDLLTLSADTGQQLWSTHVLEEHHAKAPSYGFSTSPVVYRNVLMVQIGGRDANAIVGFDKHTGRLLWKAGMDTISYQSPTLITVDGKNQLLGVGDKLLCGLEPVSGKVLWEYAHQGDGSDAGSRSMNPVVLEQNRLLLTYKGAKSVLLKLRKKEETILPEELWTSRSIRGTYSIPVSFEGYLYSYSSRFLTCVDAQTGESLWKSRQPGDGFLILVDGHLLILTKKGTLHVARATLKGYHETTSLPLFDALCWSPPGFANGSIYVRSFSEIACVAIVPVEQVVSSATTTPGVGADSEFSRFVQQVTTSQDKKTLIDAFMSQTKQFPVIEGDHLVHFVYRGDATDMGITGDLIGFRHEEPMHGIEGTDFFYYSSHVESDAQLNYQFIKDFEKTITDPLNPRKALTVFNEECSWFSMPAWVAPAHLSEPEGIARGHIETRELQSEISGSLRRLDVYLPADYDTSIKKYPVGYVHWGDAAQSQGKLPNTLDNLIGKRVAPIIVVFVYPMPGKEQQELFWDGTLWKRYTRMLVEKIVPFIDQHYRTVALAEVRANIGVGVAGFVALYSTFKYPGYFGKVSNQSAALGTWHEAALKSVVSDALTQPLQLYFEWGKYDLISPMEGWSMMAANRSLAGYLSGRGYEFVGGEVHHGYSWSNWRNHTDRVFELFFPKSD